MAVSASFAFTMTMFGIVSHNVDQVSAEVDKRTEFVYAVPQIEKKLDKIDDKTDQLINYMAEIKAELKN